MCTVYEVKLLVYKSMVSRLPNVQQCVYLLNAISLVCVLTYAKELCINAPDTLFLPKFNGRNKISGWTLILESGRHAAHTKQS